MFENIFDILMTFYNPSELRVMTRLKLNLVLEDVTTASNFRDNVIDLIEWAERHEQVQLLVTGIKEDKANITAVQDFCVNFEKKWIEHQQSSILVPLVVGAMNSNEAQNLFSGSIFSSLSVSNDDMSSFQVLREVLQTKSNLDLKTLYGEKRESWKPYSFDDKVISSHLVEVFENISEYYKRKNLLPQKTSIQLEYLSDIFFSNDLAERTRARNRLKETGGIIIVDAVSMYHPVLYQKLLQSDLGSNELVSILILAPVSDDSWKIKHLIKEYIELKLETMFNRYDTELDHRCELGTGDVKELQRWLLSILQEKLGTSEAMNPSPDALASFRKSHPITERDVQRSIFGR